MAIAENQASLTAELAAFLASTPTPEQILNYRPSERVQHRARELLDKSKDGLLSLEERDELDQLTYAERLLRLIKARLRNGSECAHE